MAQAESLSPYGVSAQTQGDTPLSLLPAESADALETIEFAEVIELVAGHAVGPLGAARVRGRRPSDDAGWITGELARAGEVAGLFRKGDMLLAEPIPDVGRALGRLRIEGSVLDGVEIGRASCRERVSFLV